MRRESRRGREREREREGEGGREGTELVLTRKHEVFE